MMSSYWRRRVTSAWSGGDGAAQNDVRPASRDTIIRDALLAELAEVCGELGYLFADPAEASQTVCILNRGALCNLYIYIYISRTPQDERRPSEPPDERGETAAQLCQCVEAIFLHGLNDSFLYWQSAAVAAIGHRTAGDRRPAPNFWPPLLVFTHRDTIEQVRIYIYIYDFEIVHWLFYEETKHICFSSSSEMKGVMSSNGKTSSN